MNEQHPGGDPVSFALSRQVAADRVFRDSVRLARSIAGTSMAALTLADDTHLWFLATSGLDVVKVRKAGSFCERTIAAGRRLIIDDALEHPDWAERDFVVAGPRMRYYAGIPMISHDRAVIGTLCVADERPHRALDDECFRHLSLVLEITTDRLEQHCRALENDRNIAKARELARVLGNETNSLATEASRLAATSRALELSTDAAMQGVRQVIHLDREIHDDLTGVRTRASGANRTVRGGDAMKSNLQLHNAVSLAVEDDIDALVGSSATLRMRSAALEVQSQRLVLLSSILDEAVAADVAGAAKGD